MSRLLAILNGRSASAGGESVTLIVAAAPAALCWPGIDAEAPSPDRRAAVLIRLGDRGRLRKIVDWVLLPAARARAERLVARQDSPSPAAVFAIAPDCDMPTWVYRVDSPAAAYADSHLLPRGAGPRALRAAVRWWIGC